MSPSSRTTTRKASRGLPRLLDWSVAAAAPGVATGLATDVGAADQLASPPPPDDPPPESRRRAVQPPDTADLPHAPHAVILADGAGEPVAELQWTEEVVATAADRAGALWRSRQQRGWSSAAEGDGWLLMQLDAIAAAGPAALPALLAHWDQALEAAGAHAVAGVALALGCMGTRAPLGALLARVEQLALDDVPRGRAVTDALVDSPHPDLGVFARAALASAHPIARALGVEVLARLHALTPAELDAALAADLAPVAAAAARSVLRLPPEEARVHIGGLHRCLGAAHPTVAWEAARALTILGLDDALEEVRRGRLQLLGANAVLLLAMAGDGNDAGVLAQRMAGALVTPAHLEALARYGHAETWAFLLDALEQPELVDAAVAALCFLFGTVVEVDALEVPHAWRSALRSQAFDREVRYRNGAPWSAMRVVEAVHEGALPARWVQQDADELAIRLRLGHVPTIEGFVEPARARLRPFLDQAGHHAGRLGEGRWARFR